MTPPLTLSYSVSEGGIVESGATTAVAALEPFKGKLDAETLRRHAIALSVVVGIESRVVMRDIWDLDDDEAERMMRWMARAFVEGDRGRGLA